jgi:hypothetical protein
MKGLLNNLWPMVFYQQGSGIECVHKEPLDGDVEVIECAFFDASNFVSDVLERRSLVDMPVLDDGAEDYGKGKVEREKDDKLEHDSPVEDDKIFARDLDAESDESCRCNDHKRSSPDTKFLGRTEHNGDYRAKVLEIEADADAKAIEIRVSKDVAWLVGLRDGE